MGLPRTGRRKDDFRTFVNKLIQYVIIIPTKSTIDAEGTHTVAPIQTQGMFSLFTVCGKSVVSDQVPN